MGSKDNGVRLEILHLAKGHGDRSFVPLHAQLFDSQAAEYCRFFAALFR